MITEGDAGAFISNEYTFSAWRGNMYIKYWHNFWLWQAGCKLLADRLQTGSHKKVLHVLFYNCLKLFLNVAGMEFNGGLLRNLCTPRCNSLSGRKRLEVKRFIGLFSFLQGESRDGRASIQDLNNYAFHALGYKAHARCYRHVKVMNHEWTKRAPESPTVVTASRG